MKNNDSHHPCPKTPSYLPASSIGPTEFEHAIECDDCWKALVRWMDAEAASLPESAEIHGRAKRLAGVGEIMAAMITNGGAARFSEVPDESLDDVTLGDVLNGSARLDSTLIRGPWQPARPNGAHSEKREERCTDSNSTENALSAAETGECSPEIEAETTGDSEEEDCGAPSGMTCAQARVNAAAAAGRAPVGPDLTEALRMVAREMGRVADGLSVATASESVCLAVAHYTMSGLCGACAERGRCLLAPDRVSVNISVPLTSSTTISPQLSLY